MQTHAIQFSFTQRAATLVQQNKVVTGTVAVPPQSALPMVGDSISLQGQGGNSYGFTVIDRMFQFNGNQARLIILLDILRQNSPFAARPAQPAAAAGAQPAVSTVSNEAGSDKAAGGKKKSGKASD